MVPWAQAAELKPATVAAFNRYVGAAQTQMAGELGSNDFLAIDRLPPAERAQAYAQLHRGEIHVAPIQAAKGSQSIRIPSGLIHHWIGTIFIPGATFSEITGLVQNYNNEENIYRPEVQKSKLLRRDGDTSKVYLQIYYKSLATAVLNAFFDNQFTRISDTQGEIRSCSTRINEVKNASRPDEIELPDGQGNGYLWRLNSYWRIQEKDGGVYLQIETIGLSRAIPPLLEPIVEPLVRNIPRKVLSDLLHDTRSAAVARQTRDTRSGSTASLEGLPASGRAATDKSLWARQTIDRPVGAP